MVPNGKCFGSLAAGPTLPINKCLLRAAGPRLPINKCRLRAADPTLPTNKCRLKLPGSQ